MSNIETIAAERYPYDDTYRDAPVSRAMYRSIVNDQRAAFIAGYNEREEWISVEEALPEIGEYVLVVVYSDVVLKGRLYNNGWGAFYADGEKLAPDVTHWQPLPQPPKQVK